MPHPQDTKNPATGMTPREAADKPLVAVNTWGFKLLDGLGTFLQAAAEASGPMTTKIMCNFPDRPDFPVLHLWASTDGQSPVARNAELRSQLTDRDRKLMQQAAEIDRLQKLVVSPAEATTAEGSA